MSEVLRRRPGDQPLPVVHDDGRPDIQSLVVADLTARRQLGIDRYGTALQAGNGRDALWDAYEESLDQSMYLRQEIEERRLLKEGHVSVETQTGLNSLAQAVDCDTVETVRWEIAEALDKCAGTKGRLLEQVRAGEDCDTCPPGFLAVVMQAEKLARALGIALDLLGVPTIDGSETA